MSFHCLTRLPLFCLIISCSNDTPASQLVINKTSEGSAATPAIVGKWSWAGSAVDENKNGMADKNEVHFSNAAKEKEFTDMNISMDDLALNFNADGTGYAGKAANDSTKFTWAAKGGTNHYITQQVTYKTSVEIYIDKSGYLVQKDSGNMMAAGQTMELTTFELFRKTLK